MPESNDRGSLTEAVFYILLSLYTPMHGYGIMQTVGEWSRGRVILGAGTLYGALNTLLEKNWIQTVPGSEKSRKKEYVITGLGRQQIDDELLRLEERMNNAKRITGGNQK
jgi:DNA-binding PadR family transcriptional regulator